MVGKQVRLGDFQQVYVCTQLLADRTSIRLEVLSPSSGNAKLILNFDDIVESRNQ